ncbi:hypothetical protein KR222_002162 [Zaprionus bogoriensis]|nr:hypothetical protein KR222_002162 [Zaprionus bogoriensis]
MNRRRILSRLSLSRTAWLLLLVCCYWTSVLELYLRAFRWPGQWVLQHLQPPYSEKIDHYDVGTRNETLDNTSIARQLYSRVRIDCLVLLTNRHERLKAEHIRSTWGNRCNRLHFSEEWSMDRAYRSIYAKHRSDLDWLLHVHVDSFVILENVRYALVGYTPEQRIYFAAFHAAYAYAHVSMRDTTDYIFSRGALEQLLSRNCLVDNVPSCLDDMQQGASGLMFPFHVAPEVLPHTLRSEFWVWPYVHRAVYSGQGFKGYTEYPILLPYVTANQFHVLNYLLYHLRPYGYTSGMPALPGSTAIPADDSIARRLAREVRILCLVLTHPHQYEKVVRSIRQTWGRRCNKLIVFSSRRQASVPGVHTVALNISEGYNLLWGKTKAAFRHVYKHHLHEADWFFKADDDTYAIIDNMRHLLHAHSPDEAVYFGCNFVYSNKVSYMSGGAGYVLSREALRRLVEQGFRSPVCNSQQVGTEDYEMGVCLASCGVVAGDSRDAHERHRFLALTLEHFMIPGRLGKDFWLYNFLRYTLKEGLECCSNYAITIHYVVYYKMYFFDFLLYDMRPYGIITGHAPLTPKTPSSAKVKTYGHA